MGIVAVAARWLNTSLIRCTPLGHLETSNLHGRGDRSSRHDARGEKSVRTAKRAAAVFVALATGWSMAAVPAHADVHFVRCAFAVAKPFIYHQDGQDLVGSRMDAKDCSTNLGSTPMTLEFEIMVSNQKPDGSWSAHTNQYVAVHDVHDGESFSVSFPNDDQLIPLRPGGYTASGTATSSVPGDAEPHHIAAETFAWGVPYIPTR